MLSPDMPASTSDSEPRARSPLPNDPPRVVVPGPGRSAVPDPGRSPMIDSTHLLPASGAPTDRMKLHVQGVIDDTKDWVDLRIKLAMIEVEERAKRKLNPLVATITEKAQEVLRPILITVAGATVLGIGALFGLVALALFLGMMFGHPAWGFLIVTILVLIAGAVVFVYGRRQMQKMEDEKDVPPPPDKDIPDPAGRVTVKAMPTQDSDDRS